MTKYKEIAIAPHRSFEAYVGSITPDSATDFEKIGLIQDGVRMFNEKTEEGGQITLLFHFTDDKGSEGIKRSNSIGVDGVKTYLTEISPDIAQPLMQEEDAKEFEAFVKGEKMPERLKDDIRRFILSMKFKWTYGVKKKILGKPVVPIGEHKLEYVVLLAKAKDQKLKKDENDEIYVEKKISLVNDPQFASFGPFRVEL